MGVPPQQFPKTKQLNFQFQEQDSSSSQSTGQSYPDVASMEEGLAKSNGKQAGGNNKSASSLGAQDFMNTSCHLDYSLSNAHIPIHYAEPYFGGLLAAFGPPAMQIHQPQMFAMAPGRVPLPPEFTQDEPIYVNAKQYNAILRRRRHRAKLEAQNKLLKIRKPYLHESRHIHALKRARGSGGRFLNVKNLQESNPGLDVTGSAQHHLAVNMSESEIQQLENHKGTASTTSCSDANSASTGDCISRVPEYKFSCYLPHVGKAMQGHSGEVRGGCQNQQGLSVL